MSELWTRQQMLEQHLREMRARDSDRDPEGAETGTGSVGEADRARAEGIAQPSSVSKEPPHDID